MSRILITLLVALCAPPAQTAQNILIGRASVIDGDTIEIQGQRIRLNGIDAPETRQTCRSANGEPYRCGKVAAEALDAFLSQSRPTKCVATGKDRYRRIVADCFRSDGTGVADWMVRNGYAFDWPRYSKGAFSASQRTAQSQRTGIWQGAADAPWEWRSNH